MQLKCKICFNLNMFKGRDGFHLTSSYMFYKQLTTYKKRIIYLKAKTMVKHTIKTVD